MVGRLLGILLIVLFPVAVLNAQICSPDAPEKLIVSGRVIAPGASFDGYHEVLILDASRLVGWGYTDSTGQFSLPEQPKGQYFVVVRIDGFKEYRERVDILGCDKIVPHFIFMEPEEEEIKPVVLDFTGEVNEIVDVAELKREFPRKAVEEFDRARAERLRGEVPRAQSRLEKLLSEYPELYDAHNVLGSIYLEAKRFREAEMAYNKAHDLRPASAAPLVSLGSLYVQEAEANNQPQPGIVGVLLPGDDAAVILDDAESVLTEAIKIKPDASFAYYLLGIVEMRRNNRTRSELSLKKALEIEPKLRWARLALGNLYVKQGRLKDAVAQFEAYLAEYGKVSNRSEVDEVRKKLVSVLEGGSE